MIEAKGLTKRFDKITALSSIDLTVADGVVFGLIGANGSGKSTLLRLIAGVYYPDAGELTVDGTAAFDNVAIKEQIFFLSDTPYFIHQADTNEMAKFYSRIYPSWSWDKFNYLTTVFPIDPKMKISTMSKGMQRQAALMLALSCCPKYLLLDEAFDGLDPVIRDVLKKLIAAGIAESGLTVIIASHNLRELEDLCDHAALLYKGEVVFNDEIDTLKTHLHKIQVAYKGVPDNAVFTGIEVVKLEKQGSLIQLVARGEREEIMQKLQATDPLFIEPLTPTLEELFIFELEVKGYDIQSIIR